MRTTWTDSNAELSAALNRLPGWQRALLLGVLLGVLGGAVGLGIVVLEPEMMIGGVIGLLAGLYILTDLKAALYAVLIVLGVLPFGTLPFKIVITPSLLDVMLGAFLLVYLFQWMTGRRRLFRATPVHGFMLAFVLMILTAFVLGLGHAPLLTNVAKQFAEMVMAIAVAFILPDVIRDESTLRRLLIMLMLVSGLTALLGIALYVLPDATTENILVRFARLGYPNGGVIRYVEDNPANAERAIGMWIDPNAFGGVLAVMGGLLFPQLFARKPATGRRWLIAGLLGLVGIAILLTFSRGALLSLAAAGVFVAVLRYRKLLWVLVIGAVLVMLLPVTQDYALRMIEGFQGADLATQMRFGEISDALTLVGRYPLFGVGFFGTPTRDIYLGVANLYLSMAGNAGLLGLGVYLSMVGAFFLYGLRAWRRPNRPARLEAYWLGTHAAIVAALAAGVFDHYFFKLEFQPSGLLFWVVFGLGLATTRLWLLAEPDPTEDEVTAESAEQPAPLPAG